MKLNESQRDALIDLLNEINNKRLMDCTWSLDDFINDHPLKKELNLSHNDGATKNAIIVNKCRVVLKWAQNKNSTDAVKEIEIYNRAVSKGLGQFSLKLNFSVELGRIRL